MKKTLLLSFFAVFVLNGCSPDKNSIFKMYGPSMMPTYEQGDLIFIDKTEKLERGDVAVFKPLKDKDDIFVKRVIGLPGETVELEDGKIKIDGNFLEESYLPEPPHHETLPSAPNGPSIFEIPEGEYFMLGDNRSASTDSRTCFKDPFQGGCGDTEDYYITIDKVLGIVK